MGFGGMSVPGNWRDVDRGDSLARVEELCTQEERILESDVETESTRQQ